MLRKAWIHTPFSIENSEDFWISAALKSVYNITTKTPKCPCSNGIPIVTDMCAGSDKSAIRQINPKIGNSNIIHNIRNKIMKEKSLKFKY